MVYLFTDTDSFSQKDYEECLILLSEQRTEKVNGYRFYKDKKLSMLAFLLLRYSLFAEYGYEKMPLFEYTETGKPTLINEPIEFSLSHCDKGVMCGLSQYPIGVDVQEDIRNPEVLFREVLSDGELAEIENGCDNICSKFTDFWTLKESWGKMHGFGILFDLKQESFDGISNEWVRRYGCMMFCGRGDGFSYSVCSKEKTDIKNVSCPKLMEFLRQLTEC